jgi:hypothetical protein
MKKLIVLAFLAFAPLSFADDKMLVRFFSDPGCPMCPTYKDAFLAFLSRNPDMASKMKITYFENSWSSDKAKYIETTGDTSGGVPLPMLSFDGGKTWVESSIGAKPDIWKYIFEAHLKKHSALQPAPEKEAGH